MNETGLQAKGGIIKCQEFRQRITEMSVYV